VADTSANFALPLKAPGRDVISTLIFPAAACYSAGGQMLLKNCRLMVFAMALGGVASFSSLARGSIEVTANTPVNWAFKGNGNFTNADLQAFLGVLNPVAGVTNVNGFLYVSSTPDGETYDLGNASLVNLYKEDADSGEEDRPYRTSYDTAFYDESEWATISYTGGDTISKEHLFLIAKDGNSDPNVYVYDLNSLGWDGEVKIKIGSADDHLFDAGGSISHMEIVGGGLTRQSGPDPVPEPMSVFVWSAFAGISACSFWIRKRRD
jgi:hypothetical protein